MVIRLSTYGIPMPASFRYKHGITTLLFFLISFTSSLAQVSGTVFRDYNANGVKDTYESGVASVTVIASFNSTTATVVSTTAGSYSFAAAAISSGTAVRLEFKSSSSGDFSAPFSSAAAGNGTSVQFVTAGTAATNINFAVNLPGDYCQSVPVLYTPCYVSGQPTTGTNAGNQFAIVGVNYDGSGSVVHPALASDVGSVWGLAYQRATKLLFSSTMIKRHVGLGPLGIGGIYLTNITNNTTQQFINLQGFNSIALASAADLTSLGSRNLPTVSTTSSQDAGAMAQVGKIGFGGLALNKTEDTLWAVNLYQKTLVSLRIGSNPASTTLTAADVKSYPIPDPGCSNGTYRPWAVTYRNGKLYVGVICDAENAAGTDADLKAHVYTFDLTTKTFSASPIFSITNMAYPKGPIHTGDAALKGPWEPWRDAWADIHVGSTSTVGTRAARAQPILSDITFDEDGAMILAFCDRGGHQLGVVQQRSIADDNVRYNGYVGGDVLRAAPTGPNSFTLENNGSSGGHTGSGVGNSQGPGGGEFFAADTYPAPTASYIHTETSMGAVLVQPGKGELTSMSMDPLEVWTGGINWFSTTNGSNLRRFQIYQTINSGGTQVNGSGGKANGLGAVKPACNPAPIEIGNRIWNDANRNGIQDPGEAGISGIAVTLYKSNTLIATATTNADGEYYFSSASGTNTSAAIYSLTALTPGSAVQLRINGSQSALSSYSLTASGQGTNGAIDSDFVPSAVGSTTAVANVTLGVSGQNVHTFDAGVYVCPTITISTPSAGTVTQCANTTYTFGVSTNAIAPDQIRLVYFTSPQSGTAMYTGGTVLATATSTTASGAKVISLPNVKLPDNVGSDVQTIYVYAILVSSNGTCFPSGSVIFRLNPRPAIMITPVVVCQGSSTTLVATGPSGTTYQWFSGSGTAVVGTSSTLATGIINTPTTYTVRGTYNTCVSDNTPYTITPVACNTCTPPSMTALATSSTVCAGSSVTVYANVSPVGSYTYNVTALAGVTLSSATSATATATGLQAGVNTFTITASSGPGCQTAVTVSVSVVAPPIITLNSATICAGEPVSLTASGGGPGVTYLFSAPGAVNNVLTVSPIITTGYTVTVTTSGGCSAMASATVVVNAKPDAGADQVLACGALGTVPTTTTLTATPVGGAWSNMAGNPTTATFTPNTAVTTVGSLSTGSYNFIYTAANGCKDTVQVTVPLCQTFCAPISTTASVSSSTVTIGSSVTLTAQVTPVGSYTYAWSGPGTITPANAETAVISNLTAGVNTFTVTVTSSPGCFTTATVSVTVLTPALSVSVTPSICQSATNQYSITGTLSLTNAVADTATITDGTSSTTVSVSAGATSVPYSLAGLASDGVLHTVVVDYASQTASTTYTAPLSCTTAPPCLLSVTVTPTACNTATNQYQAVGSVSAINATGSQIVTLSDGVNSTTVTLTGNGPASFTLIGLTSDGLVHTVTASALSCGTTSTTYAAPESCTIAVALTATPSICNIATNGYDISGTISLTNAVAGTATITDGSVSTTVSVPTGATSVAYSLTGLVSGTGSHTVAVSYATKTSSVTYPAPVSCTVAYAGLGDFVFEDSNHNGQQDTGEPGIPNVVVTLLSSTSVINSMTTDLTGHYSFTGLTPGVPYSVSFTSPAGYSATLQNVGSDETDSDGNPATGLTGTYSLTVNEYNPTVDMGYYRPASLGDFVFADNNKNGIQDAGDTPIQGVTVTLLSSGTVVATTTTNPSGLYSFTGLTPGVPYSVSFTTPTGYSATTPNTGADDTIDSDPVGGLTAPVTLTSGENNTSIDAGFIPATVELRLAIVDPGVCQPATNQYTTSGVISLTNASTGTAVVTDGPVSTTVAIITGQTTANYSLTGLVSGTSVHTVVVTLAGQTASTTYTSPGSCTSVQLSVRKAVSLSKANLGNILTYTLVISNDGSAPATTTVRDSLGTGASYVVGSASVPTGTSFTAGRPISLWDVPVLAGGQSLSMTYQVRVDSTGIIYNTASIPGDTAKVCTTVAVTMCLGDVYTLTAPSGRASYNWYRNGVLIADQVTNVLTVTQPGSYSLSSGNSGLPCSDFSCCPFILEQDSIPTFQARAVPGTCLGSAPQANGQLILSTFTAGQQYQYSAGATFNAAASLSGAPQVIPVNGVLVTTLANPATAQFYTIRVFNSSGCYTDQTVILQPTICGCPADVCVPFVIQQTKRPGRIGDPIR